MPLNRSPSPRMLAAARGGVSGGNISLLGGGAAAIATLAALTTSGPPARVMLGVTGAALASCSTGFLATHATVRSGMSHRCTRTQYAQSIWLCSEKRATPVIAHPVPQLLGACVAVI
jgi:hypothetical protein